MFGLQVTKNSLPTDIEKIGNVSSLDQSFIPHALVTATPETYSHSCGQKADHRV